MRRLLCCFLMMAFCECLSANQETQIDPDKLRNEVGAGTVRPAVAKSLGLRCGARKLDATVDYVQLAKGERYSILQAYEAMCDTRTLILFHFVKGKWQHVQTLLLSTLAGVQPTVTFPELVGEGEHQVLVRGQLVDHGTGVDQKNMTIYRLIEGRLREVFDAPESIHIEQPSSEQLYSLDQQSDFRFLPDAESGGKGRVIDERAELRQEGRTIVRFRSCAWTPEVQHFRCYEHAP